MRKALGSLDNTKEDTIRHSRPLEEILLTLALDEDKNVQAFVVQYVDQQVLSQRQQERAKVAMSSSASNGLQVDDQQPPGTPMDYSSGEDEDDLKPATIHRVELSELPLSSPNLAESNNKSDFDVHNIDFAKDTLADSQEAFVELKPTLDDVDDDNNEEEEEEFIYRPSTPVESSDSN